MAADKGHHLVLDDGQELRDHHCEARAQEGGQVVAQQQLVVLFLDEDFLALAKPPDVRMTPPPGATEPCLSMESLCARIALPALPPGIPAEAEPRAWRHCHQLDYSTSGVLLYAAHKSAAAAAAAAFEARATRKAYRALLEGWVTSALLCRPGVRAEEGAVPSADACPLPRVVHATVPGQTKRELSGARKPAGSQPPPPPAPCHPDPAGCSPPEDAAPLPSGCCAAIDLPVAEVAGASACVLGAWEGGAEGAPAGREAVTRLRLLALGHFQGRRVSWVELQPLSGRRHQLRLHAAAVGHPIVGDVTYDAHARAHAAPRMMLHALDLHLDLRALLDPRSRAPRHARAFLQARAARGGDLALALRGEDEVRGFFAPLGEDA